MLNIPEIWRVSASSCSYKMTLVFIFPECLAKIPVSNVVYFHARRRPNSCGLHGGHEKGSSRESGPNPEAGAGGQQRPGVNLDPIYHPCTIDSEGLVHFTNAVGSKGKHGRSTVLCGPD